jgi:hypothetical protein
MAYPKKRNAAQPFSRSGAAPGMGHGQVQDPSVEMAGGSKHNMWGRQKSFIFRGIRSVFLIDNQFIFRDSKFTLMLVDIGNRDEVVL